MFPLRVDAILGTIRLAVCERGDRVKARERERDIERERQGDREGGIERERRGMNDSGQAGLLVMKRSGCV